MTLAGRRRFLKAVAASPVLGAAAVSGARVVRDERPLVKLSGDGLGLSPAETVEVLQTIVATRGIEGDYYSQGGVVEELEQKMAAALGKERAVFFPTGTLANHVAVRELAGSRTRAIVPHESHLYNDSGDCVQQLSQLNLIPLASDSATFTLERVREVVERTGSGRVATGVGAILIESPVRRKRGERFDEGEMGRICAYARANGIGTHLDGARLYMASAYSGISVKDYAAHFDTVYVSLWKYFNAPSGAILAGPAEMMESMFHTRRMFGAGLPHAWPCAAVALHYFETFDEDYRRAVSAADEFATLVKQHERFDVERIPNGSNIFKLLIGSDDLDGFRDKLRAAGVVLSSPAPSFSGFYLGVNATWNRTEPETLSRQFHEAL